MRWYSLVVRASLAKFKSSGRCRVGRDLDLPRSGLFPVGQEKGARALRVKARKRFYFIFLLSRAALAAHGDSPARD